MQSITDLTLYGFVAFANSEQEIGWIHEDQSEVDYVLRRGRSLVAIEVKSGRKKSPHGLFKFKELFPQAQLVMVTKEKYDEFSSNPWAFFQQSQP